MPRRSHDLHRPTQWPTLVVWLLLAPVALLPLVWIVFTLATNRYAWIELKLDAFRLRLIGRTLLYAGSSALIAVTIAWPVSLVVGRGRGVAAAVVRALVPMGLLLPTIALAYGWKQVARLLGLSLVYASPADVARCVWTIAAWLWPVPAMGVGLALRRSDVSVQEQALLDGRLGGVRFRQLLPAVVISFVIVGILALQEFAVFEPSGISTLATEVRMVFETGAYSSVENPISQPFGSSAAAANAGESSPLPLNAADRPTSAASKLPLPLTGERVGVRGVGRGSHESGDDRATTNAATSEPTTSLAPHSRPLPSNGEREDDAGGTKVVARAGSTVSVASISTAANAPSDDAPILPNLAARSAAAVAAAGPMLALVAAGSIVCWLVARRATVSEQIDLGPWPAALNASMSATVAAAVVVSVTLGAPVVALIGSLKRVLSPGDFIEQYRPQIEGSLILAAMAAGVCAAFAILATVRRQRIAIGVAAVAFLVGGQLLAIAFIRLFNRDATAWLYDGPGLIVAAYVARFGWIALVAGDATFSPAWRPVRELAALDGASGIALFSRVLLPLAWPMLLAAVILIGVLCIGEVPATVLIGPLRPQPLVPTLMTWVHLARYDSMIEASLTLMAVTATLGAVVVALAKVAATIVGRLAVRK